MNKISVTYIVPLTLNCCSIAYEICMKLYFCFHHVVRSHPTRLGMLFSGGTCNSNIYCIFAVKIKYVKVCVKCVNIQ